MKKLPIAVMVSGNGSNLQAIIDEIEAGKLDAEIKIVISNNPAAFALERCKKHGIGFKIIKASFEDELAKVIHGSGAELICLAGFMRILSPEFIANFRGRIINMHPALLPSFPGLHAQRQAVEHGVKVSGCTVHFVNEGVDSGPIILQKAVAVEEGDTEEALAARILKEEHKLYPQAIQLIAHGAVKFNGQRVLISGGK